MATLIIARDVGSHISEGDSAMQSVTNEADGRADGQMMHAVFETAPFKMHSLSLPLPLSLFFHLAVVFLPEDGY